MKLYRNLSILFIMVINSAILMFLLFSFVGAPSIAYGKKANGTLDADFSLSPGGSANVYPGATATYTHTLTNIGDTSGVFTITVDSSWTITPQPSTFTKTVSTGTSSVITVTVTAPDNADEGSKDTMKVTAQSANDVQKFSQNTTTVQYYKIYLPTVLRPSIWEEVHSSWPADVVARSLAVCDANTIIAGTIDNSVQIYDGSSWSKASNVPNGFTVTDVVVNQDCNLAYASLYNKGIWQGVKGGGNAWTWSQVGSDNVLSTRALALAGSKLFAGGDFGIRYFDGSWHTTAVDSSHLIMDISAANPQDNNSVLYAVEWLEGQIYKANGNAPATWNKMSLPTLPDTEMRSVFGTSSGVSFVGTQSSSYQYTGGNWQQISVSGGVRGAALDGATAYLGYTSYAGVYKMSGTTPVAMNDGWSTPPKNIYGLVLADGQLYAATSTGVWAYSQP